MRHVNAILKKLEAGCPEAKTRLRHKNPFQLLVATVLSAQCTDKRVNRVTPALFKKFPTARVMARATPEGIMPLIKTCGLYRTKARSLAGIARLLVHRYRGRVPADRDELMKLPGVGRKTANVVASQAFAYDAIAVDTHVFRVANRLGLARAKTPEKTELTLMKVIPKSQWRFAHHWIIHHGRTICKARRPLCSTCSLKRLCRNYQRKKGVGSRFLSFKKL